MKLVIFLLIYFNLNSQNTNKQFIQSIVDTLNFEKSKFSSFQYPDSISEETLNFFKETYLKDNIPFDSKKAYLKGISDAIQNINDSVFYFYPKSMPDSRSTRIITTVKLVENKPISVESKRIIPYDEFDKLLLKKFNVVQKGKPIRFFEHDSSDAYFYTLSLISNKYLKYLFGNEFIEKTWNETDKIVSDLIKPVE